jgi:ferredoxin
MIFYFSGTGNSKHVAECIVDSSGEKLIYICKDNLDKKEKYHLTEHEKLGFIFPVYWYSMPTIVEEFIMNVTITGYKHQYVYGVATYGFAAGNVMNRLRMVLRRKQLLLKGVFGVRMVDNYVVGYNLIKVEEQKRILLNAEEEINKIHSMINRQEVTEYIKKGSLSFATPITSLAYKRANHTRKFYVTNACNGCRSCAVNCPCNVIHMDDRIPKWDNNCTFCLKCINGCKQAAIQYTKSTERRNRYQYHGERN